MLGFVLTLLGILGGCSKKRSQKRKDCGHWCTGFHCSLHLSHIIINSIKYITWISGSSTRICSLSFVVISAPNSYYTVQCTPPIGWWLDSRWAEFVDHLIASYEFCQADTWVPGLIVNWFRLAPGLAGHWAIDHLDSIWISIHPWFTMQILLEYYEYYYYRNTPNSYES